MRILQVHLCALARSLVHDCCSIFILFGSLWSPLGSHVGPIRAFVQVFYGLSCVCGKHFEVFGALLQVLWNPFGLTLPPLGVRFGFLLVAIQFCGRSLKTLGRVRWNIYCVKYIAGTLLLMFDVKAFLELLVSTLCLLCCLPAVQWGCGLRSI